MDMIILLGELLSVDAQTLGVGLDHRKSRLRALFHDVADLAGQLQLSLAWHRDRFDEQ